MWVQGGTTVLTGDIETVEVLNGMVCFIVCYRGLNNCFRKRLECRKKSLLSWFDAC